MGIATVRLQPELEKGLETLAGKLHRSKSWLINQAVKGFLDQEQREQTRWQETLTAMESVTQGHVVPGQAVHDWLKSWGTAEELPIPKPQR